MISWEGSLITFRHKNYLIRFWDTDSGLPYYDLCVSHQSTSTTNPLETLTLWVQHRQSTSSDSLIVHWLASTCHTDTKRYLPPSLKVCDKSSVFRETGLKCQTFDWECAARCYHHISLNIICVTIVQAKTRHFPLPSGVLWNQKYLINQEIYLQNNQ